ncbi:hypothetical protein ACWEVM_26985 [Streptomyces bauhiniae]|uniref:hypothetical protein n=1 Tax=Streptomyces bauhiniae TaxID=2340725 RepID=UPI003697FBCE
MDELSGIDEMDRRILRAKVRRSVSRSRATSRYYSALWMPVILIMLAILITGLTTATSQLLQYWNHSSDPSDVWIGLLIGYASLVAITAILKRVHGRFRRNIILKRFLILAFAAYPSFSATYSVVNESWIAYTTGAAIVPISFFIATFIFTTISKPAKRPVAPDTVYDRTAEAMLETAALISRSRTMWHSSKVSRRAVLAVEDLARTCQSTLALRSRIGRWNADIFSQTAVEALRVAHVVREHKKPIVCASAPQDFDDVAASLVSGLTALLSNDRDKLLENAPAAIFKDRVKEILRYVFPVVLLTAAATFLPMVPPISGQEKIADSIRLTFIVAAVLALVAPRSDSSTKILDVLSKATSPK